MTRCHLPLVHALLALAAWCSIEPAAAGAQTVGTFRWQLQPYCNVLILTVVQQGAQYQVDGTDDQCGAGLRAAVTGLAFFNPAGSLGFGLTVVTTPGGAPVQVDATIALPSLSGTWHDSAGGAGTFAFTPGAGTPGPARPVPARGDVTAVAAGAGLTGGGAGGDVSLAVDYTATQQRVTGVCAAGQLMVGVNQNGTVTCQSVTGTGGGDITGVVAGAGLTGGAASGDATLAVAFANTGIAATAARSDHWHQLPGTQNVGTGNSVLVNNSGSRNTALGFQAMTMGTGNGSDNTAVGNQALHQVTTGHSNSVLGATAMFGATGAHSSVAVGHRALFAVTTAARNTAVGYEALRAATTGGTNTAVGYHTLFSNTADGNTAVGAYALEQNTTGGANTALGEGALANNTTAGYNTAVGVSALYTNTLGVANTAMGSGAMYNNDTGSENTAFGRAALTNGLASYNTAVGAYALEEASSGGHNTALGRAALRLVFAGASNTAVGSGALDSASGSTNTALGASALADVTTGNANIGIGSNVGSGLATGSNNILIGSAAGGSAESNTIRLGAAQTSTFIAGISGRTSASGVAVFVNGSGQLGTATSSARFKDHIAPVGAAPLSKLRALRPVSFVYRPEVDDGARQIQYGLVAEEVAETFPELLVRDADGRPQTVRYHLLTPLLLAEVQRLERTRDADARERAAQAARLDAQAAEIARLQALVETLVATARR